MNLKHRFATATLGAAALTCSFAFAADKMSPSDRTSDMRAKCEAMTGNDRSACLDQINKRDGSSPMGNTGNTMGNTGRPADTKANSAATKSQARSDARDAITDPNKRCDDLTGNDRAACLDQVKKSTGGAPAATTGSASKAQTRAEGREAITDPNKRCDDLTGTDRLACQDQVNKAKQPRS